MPIALLILGTASWFSLAKAMKHSGRSSRVFKAVSNKARFPKFMGMLILGMQAGELANHKEHLSIVTLLAIVFAACIWGAMAMRSGVKHKLL